MEYPRSSYGPRRAYTYSTSYSYPSSSTHRNHSTRDYPREAHASNGYPDGYHTSRDNYRASYSYDGGRAYPSVGRSGDQFSHSDYRGYPSYEGHHARTSRSSIHSSSDSDQYDPYFSDNDRGSRHCSGSPHRPRTSTTRHYSYTPSCHSSRGFDHAGSSHTTRPSNTQGSSYASGRHSSHNANSIPRASTTRESFYTSGPGDYDYSRSSSYTPRASNPQGPSFSSSHNSSRNYESVPPSQSRARLVEEFDAIERTLDRLDDEYDQLERDADVFWHDRQWRESYFRRIDRIDAQWDQAEELQRRMESDPLYGGSNRSKPTRSSSRSRYSGPSDTHYSRDGNSSRSSRDSPKTEKPKPRRPQPSAEEWQQYRSYAHAEESRHKKPERSQTYSDSTRSSKGQSRSQEQSRSSRSGRNYEYREESRSREGPWSSRRETRDGYREKERTHKEPPMAKAQEDLPDYYAILGISSRASTDEIKKAAKKKRIEVHPDKTKKPGMSKQEQDRIDEIAAQVGLAADILMDPVQKEEYDIGRKYRSR